ncbi:unnamed protein product, partial [Staurois parvus]
GTESSGKTVGLRVNRHDSGHAGSSGIGLSGSTAGIGSPGMTAGTGSPGIRSLGLPAGTASSGKAVGTGSPGTGSSGSTAGIESTGLNRIVGLDQFIRLSERHQAECRL